LELEKLKRNNGHEYKQVVSFLFVNSCGENTLLELEIPRWMNKLTLVEKEELMGSWEAFDCNDIGGARPIDTHG
jgi:hypothetical protein